jgi:hypothetical protein
MQLITYPPIDRATSLRLLGPWQGILLHRVDDVYDACTANTEDPLARCIHCERGVKTEPFGVFPVLRCTVQIGKEFGKLLASPDKWQPAVWIVPRMIAEQKLGDRGRGRVYVFRLIAETEASLVKGGA